MKSFFLILFACLFIVSCAETIPVEQCLPEESYGFWYGLLHGFIAPFTFIVGIFDDEVAMYAINNNGAWYNFGFLFGASIFFGGGAKAKR